MKILHVIGREIYDSRGLPTVECELILEDETRIRASVPAGRSCGLGEAVTLRDKDRILGFGVSAAIDNLQNHIAPELIGQEPNVVSMDLAMIEKDGTEDKSNFGANAMLAASIALLKAQAHVENMHVYEMVAYLCDFESVTLPFPMFNIINGGVHADNNLWIQEFMVMPIGAQSFRASLESTVKIFYTLKALLEKNNKRVALGDEGGFVPNFDDEQEALDFIMQAIELADVNNDEFVLALDVAASEFYDSKTNKYTCNKKKFSSDSLITYYEKLSQQYPIYSIEDGLAESDYDGWKNLMKTLGEKLQIVGDDIFVTNPARILHGLEENLANAVLIKPNQIGTVTETLQAIKLCKANEVNTVVSHRSGETNDTFIVDLAVGTSSGQIKAGSCSRGERISKYNRLLRIEDTLMMSILDAGLMP